jgi:hypothetical protein
VAISSRSPFVSCPVGRHIALDAEVEPWIAADPTDPRHLIAAWQQDRNFRGGARGPVTAWTVDGGRTWTRATVPGLTTCTGGPYVLASDPVISIGPGRAYLASIAIRRDLRTDDVVVDGSGDSGETWSRPVLVRTGSFVHGDPDKEFVLADPRTPGTAYVVWVEFAKQRRGERTVDTTMFSRTTDGGRTWSPATVAYSANTETQFHELGLLPDGTILDAFAELLPRPRDEPGPIEERLAVMRSSDGGRTWSAPVTAAKLEHTTVTDPITHRPIRADSLDIGFAAGPDGRAYVAWVEDPDAPPEHVFVASSSDGGVTWSRPSVVASGVEPFLLPSMAVAANGVVGVMYDSFEPPRPDGEGRTDVWFATSVDHGSTWTTAHLAGPFDVHTARLSDRGDFVGDYQGLAGLPRSFAAAFVLARPLAERGPTDVFFASPPVAVSRR